VAFTTILDDDFTAWDKSRWWPYSGTSSASGVLFDSNLISANGGRLRLSAARQADGSWHGSGVKHTAPGLLYGRWTVTSRIEAGRGATLVHLLWPDSGWPFELDFAEDNGADRNLANGTVHWNDASGVRKQQSITYPVDLTSWHQWQVEWTPGRVVYRCDGAHATGHGGRAGAGHLRHDQRVRFHDQLRQRPGHRHHVQVRLHRDAGRLTSLPAPAPARNADRPRFPGRSPGRRGRLSVVSSGRR
jgi:hypothetical protein